MPGSVESKSSFILSGFSSSGSGSGKAVHRQAIRKPVIYLYPPSRLPDVTVELLLTSSWSFSAVYPSPQTAITSGESPIPAQSLTWAVEAEPDGRLVDKTSGAEVTYLYWEATYVLCCFSVVRPRLISFSLDTWLYSARIPVSSRQTPLGQQPP